MSVLNRRHFGRRDRNRRLLILTRDLLHYGASGQHGLAFIRDSLASDKSLNWVVTGERFAAPKTALTIGESLSRDLRNVHQRDIDTIVDTTQRGDRPLALELSLDHRVFRFDPSVVIVAVGAGDQRIDHRLAESQAFGRLLEKIHKHDAVPVVIPPTLFVEGDDESRLNRWRADILDMATERDAVVVPVDRATSLGSVIHQLRLTLGLTSPVSRYAQPVSHGEQEQESQSSQVIPIAK